MLKLFKSVAFLEGISLLALLFFAMPMKYVLHSPIYVEIIGMVHGILFIAYVSNAIRYKIKLNWNFKTFGIVCIASIIPFGTFYIDKKYLN